MKQEDTQKETMPEERESTYFEGKSWYHRTKELQDEI